MAQRVSYIRYDSLLADRYEVGILAPKILGLQTLGSRGCQNLKWFMGVLVEHQLLLNTSQDKSPYSKVESVSYNEWEKKILKTLKTF